MEVSTKRKMGQGIHSRLFQEVSNVLAVVDMYSSRNFCIQWVSQQTLRHQYT